MIEPVHAWTAYPRPAGLPPVTVRDPSWPLVSVVTPSLNQGAFIRATIESVLGQDYPNIEYWVMDGGSTDGTLEVLRAYESDSRFHWVSAPDAGQSDAINRGWSRCRGDVLAWLNSDDTYRPAALRTQVAALRAHAECGVVYGDALYVDAAGAPVQMAYGRAYRVAELLRLTIPVQPTVFLRRDVVERIGPVDTRFHSSMDSEYWVRAARVTTFWYEPRLIATYRWHARSKTVAAARGFYGDWLAILDNFFADSARQDFPRRERDRIYADLYATQARLEASGGALRSAATYAWRALARGGLRPRLFTVPLALCDRLIPLRLYSRFEGWWTARQSRRR